VFWGFFGFFGFDADGWAGDDAVLAEAVGEGGVEGVAVVGPAQGGDGFRDVAQDFVEVGDGDVGSCVFGVAPQAGLGVGGHGGVEVAGLLGVCALAEVVVGGAPV